MELCRSVGRKVKPASRNRAMCLFQSEVGIVLHRLNCGLPYLPCLQRMSTFVSLIIMMMPPVFKTGRCKKNLIRKFNSRHAKLPTYLRSFVRSLPQLKILVAQVFLKQEVNVYECLPSIRTKV